MVHTFLVAAQLSLAMLMDCLQEFEACALEFGVDLWRGLEGVVREGEGSDAGVIGAVSSGVLIHCRAESVVEG